MFGRVSATVTLPRRTSGEKAGSTGLPRVERDDQRQGEGASRPRPPYSSRWTVPGEKAGTHTATYSAPPSSGVP